MVDTSTPFDPKHPIHITRKGDPVVCIRFAEKIMGVIHDSEDGAFCSWDMQGKRLTIHEREDDEINECDLMNYVEPIEA